MAVPTVDAVGDTYGIGPVQLDISSIDAVFTATDIKFTIMFATPISAPSAFLLDSVVGYIDIDTDQDATTGVQSNQSINGLPPSSGLGLEYFIDLFSESFQPGFVDVVDDNFNLVGVAPIVYSPMSLMTTVPLSLLGNDDGLVNYGVVVGPFDEPTDEAADSGVPAVSSPAPGAVIPEPLTAALSLMGLGVLGMTTRRRSA